MVHLAPRQLLRFHAQTRSRAGLQTFHGHTNTIGPIGAQQTLHVQQRHTGGLRLGLGAQGRPIQFHRHLAGPAILQLGFGLNRAVARQLLNGRGHTRPHGGLSGPRCGLQPRHIPLHRARPLGPRLRGGR